jgi:Mn2+/Fe2+ NRAMP family transporter
MEASAGTWCDRSSMTADSRFAAPSTPNGPAKLQWLGPGVIMAASGIGSSDIIAATVAGASCGLPLLWALAVAAFAKYFLSEGIARWQLATGLTAIEGWARYLPRFVLWVFAAYLVLWTAAVSGALLGGCGLAIENITRGTVSRTWGGLAHGVLAFVLIWFVHGAVFSRVVKPLIVLMFVGILACAAIAIRDPFAILQGLLIPSIPVAGTAHVFSLIGGIGGSLTLLSYNYLLRDDGKVDARNLSVVRADLRIAYLFTAIFGISVVLIAHRVFFVPGIAITDRDAVSRMAGQLAELVGPTGFYVYSIGFWAAVLASLFGVWQTIPRVFADCYSLLRRCKTDEREAAVKTRSPHFRAALAFMALASVPFVLADRPLLVVIAFTILGSVFIPFVAATLLYLNNRVSWSSKIPHNRRGTNAILICVLLLFLVVATWEISSRF